eukprot:CAMPEP_0185025088 /NCGR_PEP_ID=MMETSP1103-20130426/8182_1 /TAXON_ID=36769 /ORGANISM="Paraphysomonas bandaiensis, Strain Caron Lab Isolate" /LENGTH=381 /DNA_ID=CAMNT_0027558209 /DNA_START=57 /DNA_END=1202 /DNA_ORIENTATION=+
MSYPLINKKAVYASKFASPFGKRFGPDGRHAVSGITATVFGAYGFVGQYVCNQLGGRGSTCFIPFRGCEMEVRSIRQMFDHGQLGFMPFSPRDENSIYEAVKNSDVVINLIGKDYETKHFVPRRLPNGKLTRKNYSFHDTHVSVPETIARISKESGVKSFIHMSALSANPDSLSEWNRSKAEGELAVRREFPESIIVRPATVFGPEDRFLNDIATSLLARPNFGLVNRGVNTVQPVFAVDVAVAVNRIINGWKDFEGKTFQLAGPDVYTYREVVEFVADITGRRVNMFDCPTVLHNLRAFLIDLGIEPIVNPDMIKRMSEDNILIEDPNLLTFADLGMKPLSMEEESFNYLATYREGGHFKMVEGYYASDEERMEKEQKAT